MFQSHLGSIGWNLPANLTDTGSWGGVPMALPSTEAAKTVIKDVASDGAKITNFADPTWTTPSANPQTSTAMIPVVSASMTMPASNNTLLWVGMAAVGALITFNMVKDRGLAPPAPVKRRKASTKKRKTSTKKRKTSGRRRAA